MSDLTPSSSMGFETDSGMSENDSVSYSPVKFTSQLKDEGVLPTMDHTDNSGSGGASVDGPDSPVRSSALDGEQNVSSRQSSALLKPPHDTNSQDSTHQSKTLLADSAGTVGQSTAESFVTACNSLHADNSLRADSAGTLQSSLMHQNKGDKYTHPKDGNSPSTRPPSDDKDTLPSDDKDTPPMSLQSETDLSTSSGSLFYTTQEVPDLGGVIIDIYEAGDPALEGGMADAERLPLSAEGSVGEATEDARMVRNPFLEAEEVEEGKVKKKPPFFTLAIISRRSCHRAGQCMCNLSLFTCRLSV